MGRLGTEELPTAQKFKLGEANAKEDLRENVRDRMRMMMAENKMMKTSMLQRENTVTWAWHRQQSAGVEGSSSPSGVAAAREHRSKPNLQKMICPRDAMSADQTSGSSGCRPQLPVRPFPPAFYQALPQTPTVFCFCCLENTMCQYYL